MIASLFATLLTALAAVASAVLLHECGHAAAARLTGHRVVRCDLGLTHASVTWAPTPRTTRRDRAVITLAGPLVNVLAALACLPLVGAPVARSLALCHGIVGLAQLLPVTLDGRPTDGRTLWRLWTARTIGAAEGGA